MKKILLFARDPGAVNCIIPLFKALKHSRRYHADLLGKDFALAQYKLEKLKFSGIAKLIPRFHLESVKRWLKQKGYGAVVTGTTASDITDKLLWRAGRELGLPTVAILDNWQNYRERFILSAKLILPDKICVMDEHAEQEMMRLGFPAHRLIITGQPYFSTIAARQKTISARAIRGLRKKLGAKARDYIITFAAEPILEDYGRPASLGYDELTIGQHVLAAMARAAAKYKNKNFVLVIRPHPRNDPHIFYKLLAASPVRRRGGQPPPNLKIVLDQPTAPQVAIAVSDLILGMSSMFLIEAYLAKKPFLSVQIGLIGKDPFLLSQRKIVKTILQPGILQSALEKAIAGKFPPLIHKPQFSQNATANIVSVINSLLYA